MRTVIRWFIKLTGVLPELVYLKRKTFFRNRKAQGRHIRGGALVVSNHTSVLDYVTLLYLFFSRTVHTLAAEVLYKSLPMRALLSCLGCVKVDRYRNDMSFLAPAVDLLKRGKVVCIFPESFLSEDKKLHAFKPSVAYIALKSGAPVIPVYQAGTYGLFKRARVAVGEPFYLRDFCSEADPSYETLEKLSALIRSRVEALSVYMEACESTRVDRLFSFHWFPYDLLRVSIWPAFELSFRPRYYYQDGCPHTRRLDGGCIVIANHGAFMDPLIIAHTFARRRVYFLAAEVLYRQNIMLKWFMKLIGAIPVDRMAGMDLKSFNRTVAVLRAGGVVGVFPEGRISETGELLPFKSGTALMAALANKPIVPIYKENGKLFRHTHVIIGRPIDPLACLPDGQITAKGLDELTDRLHGAMLALKAELERQMQPETARTNTIMEVR